MRASQLHHSGEEAGAADDPAFIIVCDAHEVLGEGFGSYDPMTVLRPFNICEEM